MYISRSGGKKHAFLFLPFSFRYQTVRSGLKFLGQTQTKRRYICSGSEKKGAYSCENVDVGQLLALKQTCEAGFEFLKPFSQRYTKSWDIHPEVEKQELLCNILQIWILAGEKRNIYQTLCCQFMSFQVKYTQRADICGQRQSNQNILRVPFYFGHSEVKKQT